MNMNKKNEISEESKYVKVSPNISLSWDNFKTKEN